MTQAKPNRPFALRAIAMAALLAFSLPALPASHPLTRINHDGQANVTAIDLVVALDWDINKPPTNYGMVLDKNYVSAVMNAASDATYTMTEGRHRLGKISVYSNKYLDNADIVIRAQEGRANASISGLNNQGMRIMMFTAFQGQLESTEAMGKTIAHEFGHYLYGLFDEYQEAGSKDAADPGSPQDGDTPRNTLMNNHLAFTGFSTPSDYADPNNRKTAHFRVYQKSAWETLISDPRADGDLARNGVPPRIWFDAFKTMAVPAEESLVKPSNPAVSRASMQLAFMDGTPRNVIVIDQGLAAEQFSALVNSAQSAVDAADPGAHIAIVAFSGSSAQVVLGLTPVGAGAADPGRQALKLALSQLTPAAASGTGGADQALLLASQLSSPLAKAQAQAKQAGLKMPKSTSVSITQTPTVLMLTKSSTQISNSTIQTLSQGGVAVNPVALKQNGGGNLNALAVATQGSYMQTGQMANLVKSTTQVVNQSEGDRIQLLKDGSVESLPQGGKFALETPVANGSLDGEITFLGYWNENDGGKISFSLTTPGGLAVTPENAADFGVRYTRDDAEGYAAFVVPVSFAYRSGRWISTLSASEPTDAVAQEVTAESDLSARIDLIGGTQADPRPPFVSVVLAGSLPVKNAVVTADVYDENGNAVASGLQLNDAGISPDAKPNDGIYTASLAGKLPSAGEYELVAHASNPSGQAVFGTAGSRVQGANMPDVPVGGLFERSATRFFFFEAPAPTDFSFKGTGSGSPDRLSLAANLHVSAADAGKQGNIYLGALFQGQWYLHNGASWVAWNGGPLPVYVSAILNDRAIQVASELDVRGLAGVQVYLGYGASEADMLDNKKYGLIYTVQ